MENWGLITGRLSVFLLDPERADQAAKKRVAAVQSHEVAHMWYVCTLCTVPSKDQSHPHPPGLVTSQRWNGGIIST